jgi:hypothetical protein
MDAIKLMAVVVVWWRHVWYGVGERTAKCAREATRRLWPASMRPLPSLPFAVSEARSILIMTTAAAPTACSVRSERSRINAIYCDGSDMISVIDVYG